MDQLSFVESLRASPSILTEGAIVERLRHEFQIPLDKHTAHAALIYNDSYRETLTEIYRQYLQIATDFHLPLMLMVPTRRANMEQVAESDYRHKSVLADNVFFLSRSRIGTSIPVYIGGLAGCRGDAYGGRYRLSVEEAMEFHFPVIRTVAESGVDYLSAGIMPQLTGAIGMVNAMTATGLSCITNFMICRDGRLIDETFIHDTTDAIEKEAPTRPLCYMANCIHPDVLHQALLHPRDDTPLVHRHFQGIQANAANLSPEELNGCEHLISPPSEKLVDKLVTLLWNFSLRICGGYYDTNQQHIRRFAEMLAYRRDKMGR